jgi:Ca2+-binding RTX toxin-like protein
VLGRPDVSQFPTDVASFRQQIDPDIENIRLEGSRAHDVVGDDRASLIIGNAGANRIHAGGDDSVLGGAGSDWLDGGLGADTIYGGAGDDVFVFGLHEDGDMIFDHEGRNTLRIAGADPAKVEAAMQGEDLVVLHDGAVVATVEAYASHAENYAGIDLGQGVRPISEFMADPAADMAGAALAAEDWLADYIPEAAGLAEPLPEP